MVPTIVESEFNKVISVSVYYNDDATSNKIIYRATTELQPIHRTQNGLKQTENIHKRNAYHVHWGSRRRGSQARLIRCGKKNITVREEKQAERSRRNINQCNTTNNTMTNNNKKGYDEMERVQWQWPKPMMMTLP